MDLNPFDPHHNDIKKHAASGFVFTGLAQAIKLFTQFFSVIILARLLKPTDFGIVALVSPIYAFATLFHDLGLAQATMQKPDITSKQVNSFFWINVGVGAAIALLLIILSPMIGWFYGDPRVVGLTIAMALLVFCGGFGNQHGAIMARKMLFRSQAVLNITGSIAAFVGSILWAYFLGGFWAIYIGMALGTILPVLGVWWYIKWRPSRPSMATETLGMLKYGLGITTSNLTNFAVQSANNVLIGRLLGEQPLGLFDRASRLLSSPLQQLISPIGDVIVPILYRLDQDDDKYRNTFLRTIGSITLAIAPGVIWAIVMANELVQKLLGSKWSDATPIFVALSFAALPQLINGSAVWLFTTQGRSGDLARLSLFSGLSSLFALLIGLFYGIEGVAISSVISQLVRTPPLWWYACRTGPVRITSVIKALTPQMLGCFLAFITLESMRNITSIPVWVFLISSCFLSYFIISLTVALFPSGRAAILRDIGFAKYLFLQTINKSSFRQSKSVN